MNTARYTAERSATYRDVFGVLEFRAIFVAYVLSLAGDWLAKVALTVLVYQRSGSALLASLTFGVSYLPWVVGGPLLTAISDWQPRRQVMIVCDLARVALVALLALPDLPMWSLVALLFVAELCAPPFASARSALLPRILEGDRYVLGSGLTHMADQSAQVVGFLLGGVAVATISARTSLLLDAATFAISAAVIARWVQRRPALEAVPRHSLWRDSQEGIRFVAGRPQLRSYVLLAWVCAAIATAPEGLSAPYAAHHGGGAIVTGLYLAANPLGYFVGAIVVGRWIRPSRREQLVRALALLTCIALVPVALDPPFPALLALLFVAGLGLAFNLPLNQMFVRAVPERLRARAFGVAVAGLMIFQGAGTFAAGAIADTVPIHLVIAGCGVLGIVLVGGVSLRWSRSMTSDGGSPAIVHLGDAAAQDPATHAPSAHFGTTD